MNIWRAGGNLLNIMIALLVFGMIVLVHEFGHFLLAKLNGVAVLEFSIGMGPRLCSFRYKGTRYSIKLLPFGGSCMMKDEDTESKDPDAFGSKSVWARISVIAAGPVFNFILAFLFAIVIVRIGGCDYPVVHQTMDGYPAKQVGIEAGDRIIRLNDRTIKSTRDVLSYMMVNPGKDLHVIWKHNTDQQGDGTGTTETKAADLKPLYDQDSGGFLIGVQFEGNTKAASLWELIGFSAYEVRYCITSTFDSFSMIFKRQVKVDEAVAGPVRIVSMVGETVDSGRKAGGIALLYTISTWFLLLSASLGVMNLLPFPALDGGRLVFLIIELFRGKPVDREKEGMVHMLGMLILMTLMVFILFNDIRNLIHF